LSKCINLKWDRQFAQKIPFKRFKIFNVMIKSMKALTSIVLAMFLTLALTGVFTKEIPFPDVPQIGP